jgi:hypothetical protein
MIILMQRFGKKIPDAVLAGLDISQGTEANGRGPSLLGLVPSKFLSHFPFAKAMPN